MEHDKLVCIYRKGVASSSLVEPIRDVTHDERRYRIWKIYTHHNDSTMHEPDVFPLIFYAISEGYEIVEKIRDGKYVFKKI